MISSSDNYRPVIKLIQVPIREKSITIQFAHSLAKNWYCAISIKYIAKPEKVYHV